MCNRQKTFELYATAAFSTELLAKKINAEHGTNWNKGYIAQLLSNPFYHGIMIIKAINILIDTHQ